MNKFNKSEVLVLFVLAILLVITPFLPSSLRPTYLYFIFNVLIIALVAEAGFLSTFPKPLEDKKQHVSEEREASSISITEKVSVGDEMKPNKVVAGVPKVDNKVKKCPSMPNLLFIGGGEAAEEVINEEVEAEDEIGGVNGQELCAKAEAFIGNFYKQLKMQREESCIYQKAF